MNNEKYFTIFKKICGEFNSQGNVKEKCLYFVEDTYFLSFDDSGKYLKFFHKMLMNRFNNYIVYFSGLILPYSSLRIILLSLLRLVQQECHVQTNTIF